jgi:hypothetical protein
MRATDALSIRLSTLARPMRIAAIVAFVVFGAPLSIQIGWAQFLSILDVRRQHS